MDVRSTSFAYPCQTRGLARDVPLTRSSRRSFREKSRCVVRVAAPGDYGTDGEEKTPSTQESSRQRLEVVTGLLREGYGIGAILTAAAFRGASVATEILKGVANGTAAARRQRAQPMPRLTKKRGPSVAERFQQAMAESMTPVQRKKESPIQSPIQDALKCETQSKNPSDSSDGRLVDQPSSIGSKETEIDALEEMSSTEMRTEENVEMYEWVMGYKKALGVLSGEQLSSRHIDRLQPAMWLHSVDDSSIESELAPRTMLSEDMELNEMDVVEDSPLDAASGVDVELDPSQAMKSVKSSEFNDDTEHDVTAAGSVGDMDKTGADINETAALVDSNLSQSDSEKIDAFVDASDIAQGLEQFSTPQDSAGRIEDRTNMESENVDVSGDLVKADPVTEKATADSDTVPSKDDVLLENNVETFEMPSIKEAPSEESSVAVNEALDILDKIANFEMEESVDDDNAPLPVSVIAQKSKNEVEDEMRRQMREESERRLKAMKLQNEVRQGRRHSAPVRVERPSSERTIHSSGISPPTQQFKGLDYIKSYAKEKQEQKTEEASNETTSSFFKPPSILQDAEKQKNQAVVGPARAYSQWNEIDRLKRVREIGTVMWLSKGGGGNDEGSGGSGGSGRGHGGSDGKGNNPDDGQWWIQVGVSMMTMTVLVFALLMAISNQLERQNQQKAKTEAK